MKKVFPAILFVFALLIATSARSQFSTTTLKTTQPITIVQARGFLISAMGADCGDEDRYFCGIKNYFTVNDNLADLVKKFGCTIQNQEHRELNTGIMAIATSNYGAAITCALDPKRALTKVGFFPSTGFNYEVAGEECLQSKNCNTIFLDTGTHEIYRGYIPPQ